MSKQWTAAEVMEMSREFQRACVLAAAADLELFDKLNGPPCSLAEASRKLESDPRGTEILLDALAALDLLDKRGDRYEVPQSVAETLTQDGNQSVLAVVQHMANCLRRWSELGRVVKTGQPNPLRASIRGEAQDYAAFIEAMDDLSAPVADALVGALGPLSFKHLLDVGGGSGTWTLAFLRKRPDAIATIFDLPNVMPQAWQRVGRSEFADRIKLVAGNYHTDALPAGADLAWVSAIVHSNSRQQNRELFKRTFEALAPGGRILIRDFLMESTRTRPVAGALFAVNMLTGPHVGGTFTVAELAEDLAAAGFVDPQVPVNDQTMNSVMSARKGA